MKRTPEAQCLLSLSFGGSENFSADKTPNQIILKKIKHIKILSEYIFGSVGHTQAGWL